MKESAESVWELAVNEDNVSLKEAIMNMHGHERLKLERDCSRVLDEIRTVKAIEWLKDYKETSGTGNE